jgi:NADH-quinone oxidoreductase subunit C
MEYTDLHSQLKETFPSAIKSSFISYGCETIEVEKEQIRDIARHLKDKLGYIFLTDLCGVHYPDNELPFAVVYHFHNLEANFRLRLKTFLNKEPSVDTICDIFASANWMERETYDFYGIDFIGHPNLIRILNVEYLDYFPLRKEYPLEDPTRPDKDDRFFGR